MLNLQDNPKRLTTFQILKERVNTTFVLAGIAKRRLGGLRYQPESHDSGGADRDRTGDPLLAKQVLSQLSYSPATELPSPGFELGSRAQAKGDQFRQTQPKVNLVGLGRVELPTSPLSGVRSNQLSYRPKRSTSSIPGASGLSDPAGFRIDLTASWHLDRYRSSNLCGRSRRS